MLRLALFPFVVFVLIVGFLAVGLHRDPGLVPSPFIGKPAPAFSAPTLFGTQPRLTSESLKGQVWMFNVWASWCAACLDEHPLLIGLQRDQVVRIVGLNYKDHPADAKNWLERFENPYNIIALDPEGDIAIDYGVYGVPETFVIDQQGVIRYKHVGPISETELAGKIKPLINALRQGYGNTPKTSSFLQTRESTMLQQAGT